MILSGALKYNHGQVINIQYHIVNRLFFFSGFVFNKQVVPYSLLMLWLAIQLILLFSNGMVTTLEAEKYITQANYFLEHGRFSTGNYYLYSTLILLIVACIKWQLSFWIIVIIQLLLNFFAFLMFYKLAFHFLKSNKLAWIVCAYYICNLFYQLYNSFLFTESLFYSLTIIYTSYLLTISRLQLKNIITLIIFLILLSLTRPTGILFLPATLLYSYFQFMKRLKMVVRIPIAIGAMAAFIFILNRLMSVGGSLDFMLPFIKENIICGVNTVFNAHIIVPQNGNSLNGLWLYIYENNGQFLKLAKLKSAAFWGLMRSYYSISHNIFLVLFFYPFYFFSLMGIVNKYRQKDRSLIFLLTIVLLYWLTTVLTCDDWHNRFFLTISPYLFLLGIAAFVRNRSDSIPINET